MLMKRNLRLLLVFLLAFIDLIDGKLSGGVKLSEINRLRRSKNGNINVDQSTIHHSKLYSDGPFCQKVVAYYEGIFKNKQNPNLNYTAQFQVRLNASQSDQRIYTIFDQWNNSLSSNKQFSFDFAYENRDIWGDQIGASYWGPFASQPGDFILTLDHGKHQNWDNSINILYFNVFNNSFQLENSIGQCTADQLELRNVWNMDPLLVNYCVCCGDYLPDPSLNCPVNPWFKPTTTTCKPTTITTRKPTTTTTHKPTTTTRKPTPFDPCAVDRIALLRSYNDRIHDHFYTTSVQEQQNAINLGYAIEGQMGFVGTSGDFRCTGLLPLYRIAFEVAAEHFYTTSYAEMQNAVNNLGGILEGITGYCMAEAGYGLVPLYRIAFGAANDHFYTIYFDEMQNAINNLGGTLEGIQCYVWQ